LARLKTILAFSLGSIASVLVSQQIRYASLIVPFLTSIGVAFAVQFISRELDRRFGVKAQGEILNQPDLITLKR
jgi:uncharacterized membrane protein YoaK (UPF0700 family)